MFLLAVAGALVLAAFAGAKEGGRARLLTSLPLDAPPGSSVDVAWRVDVPDGRGGREPFGASGVFVRLLSRTGAAATVGFDAGGPHPEGRYAATVSVPAGGIGGVRIGLQGTSCGASGCHPAPIVFPLENSPFRSSGAAVCDVAALARTLRAFVRSYNRGDLASLDRLFSRERFVWYSSGAPGLRRLGAAENRDTLLSYFQRRHRRADRFLTLAFRFNGYEPQRELGHFELRGQRRAADFRGGRAFSVLGKGALDCSRTPVRIAVMSIGSATQ